MTAPFKLYSAKDTLLGTITIPHYWAELLLERHYVNFWVGETGFFMWQAANNLVCRQAVIARHFGQMPGYGVRLWAISLEEFEQQPGCTFAPSAAYMRSLIEQL